MPTQDPGVLDEQSLLDAHPYAPRPLADLRRQFNSFLVQAATAHAKAPEGELAAAGPAILDLAEPAIRLLLQSSGDYICMRGRRVNQSGDAELLQHANIAISHLCSPVPRALHVRLLELHGPEFQFHLTELMACALEF